MKLFQTLILLDSCTVGVTLANGPQSRVCCAQMLAQGGGWCSEDTTQGSGLALSVNWHHSGSYAVSGQDADLWNWLPKPFPSPAMTHGQEPRSHFLLEMAS